MEFKLILQKPFYQKVSRSPHKFSIKTPKWIKSILISKNNKKTHLLKKLSSLATPRTKNNTKHKNNSPYQGIKINCKFNLWTTQVFNQIVQRSKIHTILQKMIIWWTIIKRKKTSHSIKNWSIRSRVKIRKINWICQVIRLFSNLRYKIQR